MQELQQSEATAAQRRIFFHAVDATDGLAPEAGLTGTGWFSKNGATPAASTGSIVELNATNMPGRYYIEATATELNTLGIIEFRYKAAACAEVIARAQVKPFDPYDAVRMGLTALPNAAAEAAGGLYTRGTGAGQINQQTNGQVDANIERVLNVVINALVSGRVDASVGAMAAGVVTAAAVATDAIDADALATDAVDEIRDAILDIVTGTADAGSSATIIKDAERTETVTDYWQHSVVEMTSGPNIGQVRRITAFNFTLDEITVAPAFKSAVGTGDTYRIVRVIADGLRPVTEGNETVDIAADGDVGADVQTWLDVAVNALASGRVDSTVGAMAADVITAAAIADNAFIAANFAAGAFDAVWAVATRILTASTNFNDLTAAEVQAEVDAALVTIHLDHLLAVDYDPAAKPGVATALLNEIIESDAGVSRFSTNALEMAVKSVQTFAELTTVIGPTPTVGDMLMWAMMSLRNKATDDGSEVTISSDDGTVIAKATITNVAGTAERAEFVAGP